MNRLAKIYTSAGIVLPSIGWDLRPTFNDRNIFFFVISRVYVSVCVSFFFFPPRMPRTYTPAPLGRYLFMNPKLHCSRDASVSHDRLRRVARPRRKLHGHPLPPPLPLGLHTVSLIFHGFSALFFFLPPSLLAMQMLSIFELQNAKCAFK